MHCKSGADRAGLAAGLALLFEGGTSQPRRCASSPGASATGSRSRTGVLDAFFVRYAAEAEGRVPFLDWVEHEYDEVALKRDFVAGGLASFLTDRVLRRE